MREVSSYEKALLCCFSISLSLPFTNRSTPRSKRHRTESTVAPSIEQLHEAYWSAAPVQHPDLPVGVQYDPGFDYPYPLSDYAELQTDLCRRHGAAEGNDVRGRDVSAGIKKEW